MGENTELSILAVMLVVLIGLALTLVGLGVLELLNRSASKFRPLYIPYPPACVALIAVGSTLIVLITSSLLEANGASNLSARDEVYENLGEIDEVLTIDFDVSEGNKDGDSYLPISQFEELRVALSDFDEIEGLAPLIVEHSFVVNTSTGKDSGSIAIRGIESDYTRALPSQECVKSFLASHTEWPFGQILSTSGNPVIVDILRGNEVFINQAAAWQLEANVGHELQMSLGNGPVELRVKDVVLNGGLGGDGATILISLAKAQEVFDKEEKVNTIFVSNRGDSKSGVDLSDEVTEYLRVLLADRWQYLNVHEVKKGALADADHATDGFASALDVLRLFSIVGGMMLISVSSAMLVTARMLETGAVYSLVNDGLQVDPSSRKAGLVKCALSALVGGLLGMLIGLSLVSIMSIVRPFENTLEVVGSYTWRSLIIAGSTGAALAIVTAFLLSRRIIHRPFRFLRVMVETLASALTRGWLTFALGVLLVAIGLRSGQTAPYSIGVTVGLIGVGLMFRRLFTQHGWSMALQCRFTGAAIGVACLFYLGAGLSQGRTLTVAIAVLVAAFEAIRQIAISKQGVVSDIEDRNAFTLIALMLLLFWGAPHAIPGFVMPNLQHTAETNFIRGMSIAAAIVWIIVYNADLFINGIYNLLKRFSQRL